MPRLTAIVNSFNVSCYASSLNANANVSDHHSASTLAYDSDLHSDNLHAYGLNNAHHSAPTSIPTSTPAEPQHDSDNDNYD